jgi:hypothetical protein
MFPIMDVLVMMCVWEVTGVAELLDAVLAVATGLQLLTGHAASRL